MPRRITILTYPLVLATYPVIFLYAENTREAISISEVLVTLAAVIAATALVLLAFRLFIKDSVKVSVIVALLLVIFFSYDVVRGILANWATVSIAGIPISQHRYLLPASGVLAIAGTSLVILYRGSLARLMQLAAFVALALVLLNVGRIGFATLGSADQGQQVSFDRQPQVDQLPDIYYIILDAYGRADVLKENFGHDNSAFVGWLTNKGFFVASDSRSNYVHSHLSMGSSLNMRYLTGNEDGGWLVKENAVVSFLQGLGYQYVHFGSGWAITKRNKQADVEILMGNRLQLILNEFSSALVRHTIADPLARVARLDLDSAFTANYAKRFNYNMRRLREIPDIPGPTFSFSHNLQPHPPFVFDRDGNLPRDSRMDLTAKGPGQNEMYIDQLVYVNKAVQSMVTGLLERSPTEPIIIIQADHGPYASDDTWFDNPSDRFVLERTAIFNAYYLPKYCRSGLYPTITPVNTFRAVFDSCLGTNLGLLADESYWSRDDPPIDFSQLQP